MNKNNNGNFFLSNQVNNYFQSSDGAHNHHQLARYRSAPSSFLAALLDNDNNSGSNGGGDDEAEAEAEALMFSDFFNGSATNAADNPDSNRKNHSGDKNPNVAHRVGGGSMKQEAVENHQVAGGYEGGGGGAVVGSYSLGMEADVHLGMRTADNRLNNSSNLVRQSSSPAGFFKGFSVMGDVGSYRLQTQASNHLSNHINFSSSRASSYMPSIPENPNAPNSGNNNSFLQDSWISNGNNDSFNGSKRNRDGDLNMIGENGKRPAGGLVHHSSLPKTASEMATAEKFLHFQQQDSIQIRAKRGCATHPRSIAERMRRTRISEKMKKLQDLFPHLDKQTNTADMLDMAVESIKELQKQVQVLEERKARCVCPNKSQET